MNNPIRHRTLGTAGNPSILLIHGWMMSGKVWNRVAPLLADFHLIVPDLRGCGASVAPDATFALEDHLQDLVNFCRDLDIADCHLVGHSAGGQLAMLLAGEEHDRFRTLTLMNTVPVNGLALPDELQTVFRNSGKRREELERILDMACIQLAQADRETLLDDAESIPAETITGWFESWTRGRPDATLADIRMPATVIATDDPFLPPDFLRNAIVDRLQNARLEILSGPGHYPQVETPETTAKLLRRLWMPTS